MSFRTLGIIEIVIAAVLLLVGQLLLALIFGGLGVFMIFGIKEKGSSAKKPSAAGRPAPTRQQTPPVPQRIPTVQPQAVPAGFPAADAYAYRGSVDNYFQDLLQSAFPGYQAEKNAVLNGSSPAAGSWTCSCGTANTGNFCTNCGSAKPLDNSWTCGCGQRNTGRFCANCGSAKPAPQAAAVPNTASLTFLLRQNGAPKVGIILCGKYEWDSESVLNTMEACKNASIPCLRFMREFRNDAGYVTQRIRNTLR